MFLAFCCFAALEAADENEIAISHFVIDLKSGQSVEMHIGEKPRVTNVGGKLSLKSPSYEAEYPWEDVAKFRFERLESSIAIEPAEASEAEIYEAGGYLLFRGFTPGAVAAAVGVDGRVAAETRIGADGSARLHLSALTKGLYIITAESKSFKIRKL